MQLLSRVYKIYSAVAAEKMIRERNKKIQDRGIQLIAKNTRQSSFCM